MGGLSIKPNWTLIWPSDSLWLFIMTIIPWLIFRSINTKNRKKKIYKAFFLGRPHGYHLLLSPKEWFLKPVDMTSWIWRLIAYDPSEQHSHTKDHQDQNTGCLLKITLDLLTQTLWNRTIESFFSFFNSYSRSSYAKTCQSAVLKLFILRTPLKIEDPKEHLFMDIHQFYCITN